MYDTWVISGVGLNVKHVDPHLNNEKIVNLISEVYPEDQEIRDAIESGDYSVFSFYDYIYGRKAENLADFLHFCDDTETLTFGDDGNGEEFLYYPPSLPWQRRKNEPKTLQDVIDRIVAAIQKVTDMTEEEIVKIIDTDLYIPGGI